MIIDIADAVISVPHPSKLSIYQAFTASTAGHLSGLINAKYSRLLAPLSHDIVQCNQSAHLSPLLTSLARVVTSPSSRRRRGPVGRCRWSRRRRGGTVRSRRRADGCGGESLQRSGAALQGPLAGGLAERLRRWSAAQHGPVSPSGG